MCKSITALSLFLYSLPLCAQSVDTTFVRTAADNAAKLYEQQILGQSALYNGKEYKEPEQTNDQHPFFGSDDWVYGSVNYHSQTFNQVPLLYDITSDALVTENFYNAEEIVLVKERLEGFTINGHTFIKINNKTTGGMLPASGFYELIHDGPTQVIARWQKTIRERIVGQEIEIDFDARTRFYVFKNGKYFIVRNKGALLKILGDEKAALRQYIKKNNLQFRQSPDVMLKQLVAYYDTLKKMK
jgi:hypothetical protein